MKTVFARGAAVLTAGVLACASTAAVAQPAATPSAQPAPAAAPGPEAVTQAGQHFARGVRMYQEDDFRGAFIEFSRAYELAPNWSVLYNIGQSSYQLRDYAAALRMLQKYVVEGGDQIAADRRTQVDREIAELRGRVAHLTVVSSVEGVDIALDDASLGPASASEALLVGEGRHKVTTSRAGYVPATKVVDIAGGDTLTLHLDPTPVAPVVVVAHDSPSYTGAAITGIVGLAGIAAGTVFGVLAMNDKSSLRAECTDAKVCPASAQNDIDAFGRNGAISTVAFGVGSAGVVLSGILFFHERGKDGGTQAHVTPWIGPGAGGVAGRF